jgi:hypothetical protein
MDQDQLLTVAIDVDDRKTIAEVLLAFDNPNFGHSDLQAAAAYWSDVVRESEILEAADVGTVAWLLRDASAWRNAPTSTRARARYWATYLEGRLMS